VKEAVAQWYRGSQATPGVPLEGDEPTPVRTVENVWCISGFDPAGAFLLTHIVATEGSSTKGRVEPGKISKAMNVGVANFQILPGEGFGLLRFGMTRESIEGKAGKAINSTFEKGEGAEYRVISLGRDGRRGTCCKRWVHGDWDADAILSERSWLQVW
jgi:hypothetical protein